ncbi:D-alanyl-D-alanine carboxypeptidase [Cytobacillus eiseniae]|uniref:D-alanyl-D-alanine carboxypeptidase n=1 Tax=Cytobacillus eiseniae TaxID=762947 RepID=A0ABS4R9G5_9BACI|nr:serine hydrolase [Cytobacillus eiseniae]MBP2239526.1 D-alanyl-D-alanine carboxypeptidase [Cytobacillus eiseniae]
MKIIIWLIAGGVVLSGIIIGIGIIQYKREVTETNPDYIIELMKEKAKNNTISLSINHNNENWVQVNENIPLPLASTVKIIIAIEYAKQAADGRVNPNSNVSLKDLESYFVPKTDGGAHKAWLAQLKREQYTDKVPLKEVANGMIAFSSNANTDYLIQVLGLDRINQVLPQLGIPNHEPIYPLVSSLFIPSRLMAEKNITKEEALTLLRDMDMEEYRNRAIHIHKNWHTEKPTANEKKRLIKEFDMEFQKVWSDRLTKATTKEYASLLSKLNRKEFFNMDVHEHLDPLMEQLMKNPNNREWLLHAGQKGGSTAFVFTLAMYATDKEGNQTEIAFFSNDLSIIEQAKLSQVMNAFQLEFLTNSDFREYVKSELSHL